MRKATKQARAAVEAYAAVKDREDFDAPRMRAAVIELGTAQATLAALVENRPDDQ